MANPEKRRFVVGWRGKYRRLLLFAFDGKQTLTRRQANRFIHRAKLTCAMEAQIYELVPVPEEK